MQFFASPDNLSFYAIRNWQKERGDEIRLQVGELNFTYNTTEMNHRLKENKDRIMRSKYKNFINQLDYLKNLYYNTREGNDR